MFRFSDRKKNGKIIKLSFFELSDDISNDLNHSFAMYGFSMVKKETGRPLRFYEASLFQFINPKAWSIAITVASGFFPTEENIFIGVAFVTITAAVICFPTISLWALFGSGLRKFVGDIITKKIIEYVLALLLVLTGLFILIK